MELYNTLTQKKDPFVPHIPGQVKMYTCGPTVYHYAHIGNLRTYIMEDVLEKFLRYDGYQVDRVMNITDVGHLSSDADTGEDKMLAGARREHKTVLDRQILYRRLFCRLRETPHPQARHRSPRHQPGRRFHPYGGSAAPERLCL